MLFIVNTAVILNQSDFQGLPQFCWMAFQQHKIEHIEFFF